MELAVYVPGQPGLRQVPEYEITESDSTTLARAG